jgi:hypothetical protein
MVAIAAVDEPLAGVWLIMDKVVEPTGWLQPLRRSHKMEKDKGGTPYTAPGNKPATAGTRVTIHTPKGPTPGRMQGGGYVKPDKKK